MFVFFLKMPIKSHSLDPSLTRSEAASLIDATKVTEMSREITLSRSPAEGVGRRISHEMRAQGGASHNNDIDDDGVTSAAETQRRPDSQEVAELPSEDDVGKRREHSRLTSR